MQAYIFVAHRPSSSPPLREELGHVGARSLAILLLFHSLPDSRSVRL